MTFAWRPGSPYDVAATQGADIVLASDCRAHNLVVLQKGEDVAFCVTVRFPVRPHGETMYWQADANNPLSVTPLSNVPDVPGRSPESSRATAPKKLHVYVPFSCPRNSLVRGILGGLRGFFQRPYVCYLRWAKSPIANR